MLKPHSDPWYDRLSHMQEGYYYPWRSRRLRFNGEDVYLQLVEEHLTPETDVLDVACGSGGVALEIAGRCRTVLGYDRVASFIALANAEVQRRQIENVNFVCVDSSPDANSGKANIPAGDNRFDLIICRRGPLHWLADVRRVARPGAVIIQLMPAHIVVPPWYYQLPPSLRYSTQTYEQRYKKVERRLLQAGLNFHSTWMFDRPEMFDDVDQFQIMLTWGYAGDELPAFQELESVVHGIFERYAGEGGLAVPRGHFLWMSRVE